MLAQFRQCGHGEKEVAEIAECQRLVERLVDGTRQSALLEKKQWNHSRVVKIKETETEDE